MGTNNLKVDLDPREDKEGQIYYIGRLQFPGRLCFKDGVTFLMFLSEDGAEEIQIATNNKEHTTFSRYSKRNDRLKIAVESREDQFKKIFYVAKVQFQGYIDCTAGIVFLLFNSKKGSEELQVAGDLSLTDQEYPVVQRTYPVIQTK
jgi:hypothetical protein